MCGIIAIASNKPVTSQLIRGLQHLAYRGYDSAGIALIDQQSRLQCIKQAGKVAQLEQALQQQKDPAIYNAQLGIAHTRWATHGEANSENAHPHISQQHIAIVHNGIIENYQALRKQLVADGYNFISNTDSEVIAHLLHKNSLLQSDFKQAMLNTCEKLEGSCSFVALNQQQPHTIYGYCQGSPLLVGIAENSLLLSSDAHAISTWAKQVIYLENHDIVCIQQDRHTIYNQALQPVEREPKPLDLHLQPDQGKQGYSHFMQKEIHQQPDAIWRTLSQQPHTSYSAGNTLTLASTNSLLNQQAQNIVQQIEAIQIVACGSSYHAGLVAQHWLEQLLGIPTRVDIASEYRHRQPILTEKSLFLALSQSGETADTLAALAIAKQQGYAGLAAICNAAHSSLARACDILLTTYAGTEIGVAATKTFTCQLASLLQLSLAIAECKKIENPAITHMQHSLLHIPKLIKATIDLEPAIQKIAADFADKQHALFLGRGIHLPIAMEGALKLKEISYIHAEAYAAGELKHGPLALIDQNTPVIVVAPHDKLWPKLAANIAETAARGAQVYLFADEKLAINNLPNQHLMTLPHCPAELSPFIQTVALQWLAYHVALIKGSDVDQPRNLAKSVTVE